MSRHFLIAEDHELSSWGYKFILQIHFPGSSYEIVKSSKDLQRELDLRADKYDFALWDLQLSDGDTLAMVKETVKLHPILPILVVSSASEEIYAPSLYAAGVSGYLNKNADIDDLVGAIRCILAGNIYRSKSYQKFLASGHSQSGNPFSSLSNQERHVLNLLLTGKRDKEIGVEMRLSQSSIATYKRRLLAKLRVTSVSELHQLAMLYGTI